MLPSHWLRYVLTGLCTAWFAAGVTAAPEDSLASLRREIEELKKRDAEKQRIIDQLRQRLDALDEKAGAATGRAADGAEGGEHAGPTAAACAHASGEHGAGHGGAAPEACAHAHKEEGGEHAHDSGPGDTAGPHMSLSLDVMAAAGTSTRPDGEIPLIEGGGHDPDRKGFSLRQAELSFAGAVDPWFRAEAYLVAGIDSRTGETEVELEEAYALSSCLPGGLEIKAGHFLTEFGLFNPTHPHAWVWLDQPVIDTRVFGPDGMRAPGCRLSWRPPLPWRARLLASLQNPSGETMRSFLGPPATDEAEKWRDGPSWPAGKAGRLGRAPVHGGDGSSAPGGWPVIDQEVRGLANLVYLLRWENAFELAAGTTLAFGGSWCHGPNPTGPAADTVIAGLDASLKWRSARDGGWPAFTLQGEFIRRDYSAAAWEARDGQAAAFLLPETSLVDWGIDVQGVFTFGKGLAAGLRCEYASGRNDGLVLRAADPWRADRTRLSPVLAWTPSHFSRIRLQYSFDDSEALSPRRSHSLWLGLEFRLGDHPAHDD